MESRADHTQIHVMKSLLVIGDSATAFVHTELDSLEYRLASNGMEMRDWENENLPLSHSQLFANGYWVGSDYDTQRAIRRVERFAGKLLLASRPR